MKGSAVRIRSSALQKPRTRGFLRLNEADRPRHYHRGVSSFVHEHDVVRLLKMVAGWPAGTEGTVLLIAGGSLVIEPPSGFDGFNYIDAFGSDVEVIWRLGVGTLSPPLRAGGPPD